MPALVIHTDTLFTTRTQAATIAWNMAAKSNSEVREKMTITDVEALIDVACMMTCDQIYNSDEWQRLQETISGPVSADGTYEPLPAFYPDSFTPERKGSLFISGYDAAADCVNSLEELYLGYGMDDIACYVVSGGSNGGAVIYVADGQGVPIVAGTMTIRGCRQYLFAALPENIKDTFLNVLADIVKAKMPGAANGPSAQG
jgi:hypothetical protein